MVSELEMIAALRSVAVGIGDDAAVLPGGLVLASDMLVEGVHFDRDRSDPFAVGRRAAGANLSDMAAMGAVPVCMVAAFGVPARLRSRWPSWRRGIADYGVELVGGDLSRADQLVISIAGAGPGRAAGGAVGRQAGRRPGGDGRAGRPGRLGLHGSRHAAASPRAACWVSLQRR